MKRANLSRVSVAGYCVIGGASLPEALGLFGLIVLIDESLGRTEAVTPLWRRFT